MLDVFASGFSGLIAGFLHLSMPNIIMIVIGGILLFPRNQEGL